MRFITRLISILLIFVIFALNFSMIHVNAQEDYEFVLVNVQTSEDSVSFKLKMLKDGTDLFINTNDVSHIVPYELIASNSPQELVSYKRGYKIVNFSLKDRKVYFPNQNFSSEYYGAKLANGEYYLSLFSILPWLDASAMNINGNLLVLSEPIIFWEVYEDFLSLPSTDFGAHLGDDYEAAGNTILMTIFWDNLFSLVDIEETATKLIPAGDGYSYFTKKNYMECLYSMGVNNPLENEAIKDIFTTTGIMNNLGGISKQAGIDLSSFKVTDEFEQWMYENGLDDATQKGVYDTVDYIKGTYTILKGAKYLKLFSEWLNCTAIAMNYSPEYINALDSLLKYTHQNETKNDLVIWDAADQTIKDLKDPSQKIARTSAEFGFGEALDLVFEPSMPSVIAKFSIALAKVLFSEQFDAIDKVSKIPVYADIEYTARDMIRDYKGLEPSTNPSIKMLHGVMISSLATKKSLVAFKAWDKVKEVDFAELDKQIEKCDEVFAKSIVCTTGLEYEMAFNKSTHPDMPNMKRWQEEEYYNRLAFSELKYENCTDNIQTNNITAPCIGTVILTPQGTLYWQYNKESYTLDTITGLVENKTAKNELILHTNCGKKTIVTDSGFGELAYSEKANKLFYTAYNGEEMVLCSCNLDGNERQSHNPCETILGITEPGNYLIFKEKNSGATVSIDTTNFKTVSLLPKDKKFLACSDQVIYFEDNSVVSSEDNANGATTLQSINADGTNQKELYRTKADLFPEDSPFYFDQYKSSHIKHIYFDNDYVYFSYGTYGTGEGVAFGLEPEAKIVRLKKDGSDGEIVAGNDKLVSDCFTVDSNGNIKYGEDNSFNQTNKDFFYIKKTTMLITSIGFFEKDSGSVVEYEIPAIQNYHDNEGWQSSVTFAQIIDDEIYINIEYFIKDYTKGWRGEYVKFDNILFTKNISTNSFEVIYQNEYMN